jgi:uncharacterized protein YbaP (TraB family)
MRGFAIAVLAASVAAAYPAFAGTPLLHTHKTAFNGPVSPRPPAATTKAPAASDTIEATPAMWVVHGPKGTAYLLGSIHYLPKNVHWQTPEIAAAMKRADTFVFEAPMDEEAWSNARAEFPKDTLLPLDISLPSFFDQEMRDDYRHVMFQIHGNPEGLVYLRPWVAAKAIQGQADGSENIKGLSLEEGVDKKVYLEAKARGVTQFRAFETVALHLHLLTDNGNIDEGMAELRRTLKSILAESSDQTAAQRLWDAWYKGDIKALAALGPENPKMPPAERKAMLDDRNHAWIPQITAMLNEKHTYFITVGAAHLVGKIGVPTLLREHGFRVDGPDTLVSTNVTSTNANGLRASF